MVVEQIRIGSDNFSYLIYDPQTREGALVDPGFDASGCLERIQELGLDLQYVIATHKHQDHVHDAPRVQNATGARFAAFQDAEIPLKDEDKLKVGDLVLKIMHTPGHTPDSICIILGDEYLITGDTVFIGDCGRCDLPGGSIEDMFDSLQRIKELDGSLIVLPGHDYGHIKRDSLEGQIRTSKVFIASDIKEFSGIDQ